MKRKRKSNYLGGYHGATLMAWCPEDQRFEALGSTLAALVGEGGICFVAPYHPDFEDWTDDYVPEQNVFVPPREAIEVIRSTYEIDRCASARMLEFRTSCGRKLALNAALTRDRRLAHIPGHPTLYIALFSEAFAEGGLLPEAAMRFKGISAPMEFDAGVAWFMATNDTMHLLKRFCTAHPAITMGCCLEGPEWSAPLTGAASYHADGYPGRDLALSWIHLHDKDPLDLAVGWTIDVLRERVEAAPPNSSIWIVDEDRLSREQVLAALDVPRKTLVETLDAAANKFHPRWDAMMVAGFGTYLQALTDPGDRELEAFLVTEEHIKLIEECSPAYVKHLDNGALILHAHPDRTLWPLWADALDLLGIRPKTT